MEKCSILWKIAQAKLKAYIKHMVYDRDKTEYIHLAFIDLCIYIIFLGATTIFAMSTREISLFYYKQLIDNRFIYYPTHNEQDFELNFEDLVTAGDWWSFTENVLIKNLDHFVPENGTIGFTYDGHILIGTPRLRQIRVRNETCTIHSAFRNQFRTCFGEYSVMNEDKSGFYNAAYMNQFHSIWGRIASYYGGGYVEELSSDLLENQKHLNELKNSSWIDRGTRLIAIEFALYNANVNLLCNTKLFAEIPPSGGILTSDFILPMKRSYQCHGLFECICTLIFYLLLVYYTVEILLKISLIGFFNFLGSLWNFLDFTVVLLGYISLVYIVWHNVYLEHFFNTHERQEDDYKILDELCHWNMRFNAAIGICVFIIWIKIFKYLRLNKTMLQFSTTLGRAWNDLLGFAIMFAIVFIAYANLSVLLFGTIHINFTNFPRAVLTMIRMVLGDFNYLEVREANKILSPIYFLSYVLFVFFILLNMFLAIVNDTYSNVKSEIVHGEGDDYMNYFKNLVKKVKNKIMGQKSKKIDEENELEEVLVPTEPVAEEPSQLPEASSQKLLSEWFRVVSYPRSPEEEEALGKRIQKMEQAVEKITQHLQSIFRIIDENSKKYE